MEEQIEIMTLHLYSALYFKKGFVYNLLHFFLLTLWQRQRQHYFFCFKDAETKHGFLSHTKLLTECIENFPYTEPGTANQETSPPPYTNLRFTSVRKLISE